jgi:peptide/nickel transport system permease protein
MLRYFARRVLWAAVLLVVITFVTFVVFFQVPQDPARFLVRSQNPTEQQLAEARKQLGVDKPIYEQYAKFVWRALHLDFGSSYESIGQRREDSVARQLVQAAPVTISLFFGAAILWLAISIPLGTIGALWPRSFLDRGLLVFALLAISIHPVSLGLILRHFVGYRWQVTPTEGYCPLVGQGGVIPTAEGVVTCGGFADWSQHLLLPWLTFALLFVALYSRMVRISVMNILHEPWVRVARARGASEVRVLRSHVMRHALLPIVPMLSMDLGIMFGSAIFVERVFRLPGLGSMSVSALRGEIGYDLPVLVALVLFVSSFIILLNLLADLVYAWMDPRIRIS